MAKANEGIKINQNLLASWGINTPFTKSFKASAIYCKRPL